MKSTVFYILTLALVLTGCSKEAATPAVPKTGIEMVSIGPINFGGILVSTPQVPSFRDAAVRVYNYGPGTLDTTNLVFSQLHNKPTDTPLSAAEKAKMVLAIPFKIQSVSSPCSNGSLPVGSSCVIAIRFETFLPGIYSQDLKLCLDASTCTSLTTTGRGMIGGVMSIDETRWDVQQTYAGIETRKTFLISNFGDYTIAAPTVTLVPGVTIGLNTCGSFIATQKACSIELVAKKTAFGYTNELIMFNAGAGGTTCPLIDLVNSKGNVCVNIENTVIAGPASGTIGFISPPITIVADGTSQYSVTTQPIKDQYGNAVIDGTSVRISSGNATVITPSPQTTVSGCYINNALGTKDPLNQQPPAVPVSEENTPTFCTNKGGGRVWLNGQVTFTFQAPTTKGFATISLLSGDANGFLRAAATAGPPSGILEVQAYPTSITANGNTQVVFKLLPVKDQFGNVVEDGQTIRFFLQGGGTLSSSSNFTILGSTTVALTAASQSGTAIVQFRASPVYDSNNNIIDWGAKGNYQITYTPGFPAGVIPITANNPAIYAVEDQSFETQGIPIYSTITIGPVRDITGNIVATNTPVNINVVGGRNVTFQNPVYPVTGYTDDTGKISMIMAGNGVRGYINITAQGQNGSTAYGAYNLWAFTQSRYLPTNNILDNRFTLYETVAPAASLPDLITTKWAPYGAQDLFPMSLNDGQTLTLINRSSTTINPFLTNMSYIQSPCWFTRDAKLQLGPCPIDDYKSNKGSLVYDAVSTNGAAVNVNGPSHRPLLTLKNQHAYSAADEVPACGSFNVSECDNIRQGSYSSGNHDPVSRGGWTNHWGSPVLGAAGFLPNDNTYVYFGGAFFYNGTEDYCPRVQANVCTINTYTTQASCQADTNAQWINSAQAQATCDSRPSCQWNTGNLTCTFRSNQSLFGVTSDWASLFFNMDQVNQQVSSTFQYGAMDSDQVGEYPPESVLAATVNNGNDQLYTFGGYDSGSQIAKKDLYVLNGNSKKWTMIYAEGDPNERGDNAVPSPRYQHAITYVKANNSIYVGGGLRQYTCSEFITKGGCLASPACTWDDSTAIKYIYNDYSSIHLPAMESLYGEYCKPVNSTVCNDIDPGLNPYASTSAPNTAQNECGRRQGCQWNAGTSTCSLRSGANTTGGGWSNAQDFWQLDLSPLDDGNSSTSPTWKKLCDSQEPYIGGNQSTPNPAYRSCGLPSGTCSNLTYTTQTACQSAGGSWSTTFYPDLRSQTNLRAVSSPLGNGISERHTNMIWNPLKNKIYMSWEGVNNLLAYDPNTNIFTTPTSGAVMGLANSYQTLFSPYTGKTFAYKRGSINSVNSTVSSYENDPNERRYIRAEISLGSGTKQYATTVKPIIRGSGNVGFCSSSLFGNRSECIIKGNCSNATYSNTSQSSCNAVGAAWTPHTWTLETQGIIAYVYNYSTNAWVLIGSNTFITQSSDISGFANNEISKEFLNAAARDLVSADGKVQILVMPQGNPANGRTQELNIESIAIEGRF